MKRMTRTSGVAVCATLLCAALGAQGTDAPKREASPLCDACRQVCERPLNYDDALLDESTDHYLPAAARAIARAAAVEMAEKLRSIHREYETGYFGRAYESNAREIEGLTSRPAEEPASSAEIRSLKSVRAALYADTIVGLEALAARSASQQLLTVLAARKAALDGVLANMAARQQMRAAERLAVCDVLAAYKSQ
jgi:hypothetical protein